MIYAFVHKESGLLKVIQTETEQQARTQLAQKVDDPENFFLDHISGDHDVDLEVNPKTGRLKIK